MNLQRKESNKETETTMHVPSKETITQAYHAKSTHKAYGTYQRQFIKYCQEYKGGIDPCTATHNDCTDFFHHLYSHGKKARTIDLAKTALVAFFSENNIKPNPAQNPESKRYVVGLQKYNKQNNIDEETKAHPVSVHELSIIMNSFSDHHFFLGAMYRFLYCASFIGCFRISEMLNLSWDDICLKKDEKCEYVSVRLKWHKKANVQDDCQIYNLVDETVFPCLKVCSMFQDYQEVIRKSSPNITSRAFVFPSITFPSASGVPIVNWYRQIDQNQVRQHLREIVQRNSDLNTGINLHSMRRGGSFYRVFESPERRFNFRELMAWCRWADPKTCCEYLVTRELSAQIDPQNLLRCKVSNSLPLMIESSSAVDHTVEQTCNQILQKIASNVPDKTQTKLKQTNLNSYVNQVAIPTASSAREAWDQWFFADPQRGLYQPLKSFDDQMIRKDRRKYSERLTLAKAFNRYSSYESFEESYVGFTSSYRTILQEVRKRKRESRL